MAKNKRALDLARKIVEVNEFKPKADPDCARCSGSEKCEEVSPHNGNTYLSTCDCMYRNRPPSVHFSQFDNGLLLMARYYLKGT